jgi:hypothetical protein
MAVTITPKERSSKSNWKRMCEANNKLMYQDGMLTKKGWRIDDIDANSISEQLTKQGIDHTKIDAYLIEIN